VVPTEPGELFGIYSNHTVFPGDHVALFVVRRWRSSPVTIPNREIAAAEFFAPDALPSDTTGGARRRIQELVASSPRAAEW
jgi:hypothetical protein